MTDNRTTELRRLLDERGIVWMDVYRPTIFRTCWRTGDADVYCYFDEDKSTGLFELHISGYDFTPEQAIVATLGNGMLTAEQVREAAKSNSRQYESPVDDGVWITEYDWQAIATTLNGVLGVCGCELVYGEDDDGVDGWYTQCGGWFAATFKNGRMVHPRFCQLCGGKAVKR